VTQDIDASWLVFLEQDKGNAPKTIANKHGFLSGGLRAAVEQRPVPLLAFNPCTGMRLPRHGRSEIDIFDNYEWELFEELIIERWRPQAEFGLVSMARPSEIGALLVRDVHPVTGAVRINKAWKDGGSRLVLGDPKTERGIRTVNIPVETLDRLNLSPDGDEYLFCTQDTRGRSPPPTSMRRRGNRPGGVSMRSPALPPRSTRARTSWPTGI
jgi:integrase